MSLRAGPFELVQSSARRRTCFPCGQRPAREMSRPGLDGATRASQQGNKGAGLFPLPDSHSSVCRAGPTAGHCNDQPAACRAHGLSCCGTSHRAAVCAPAPGRGCPSPRLPPCTDVRRSVTFRDTGVPQETRPRHRGPCSPQTLTGSLTHPVHVGSPGCQTPVPRAAPPPAPGEQFQPRHQARRRQKPALWPRALRRARRWA